jgi:release factor glutamine methyltransferase
MSAPLTIAAALDDARRRLGAAGIDDARREARVLVAHATGLEPAAIIGHPERHIAPEAARVLTEAVSDRARRRPMAQVTGAREFWSLEFRVTPATLDPRPDSETLIEAVLGQVDDRRAPCRVLDLGTGSGCLLLALLRELPNATGLGIDISVEAIAVAAANARALGLGGRACFAVADWDLGIAGAFDIVVCNPPYIPTDRIDRLEPEVARFEPRGALDGGRDGLDAYRALAPCLAGRLAPGGVAAVEIGAGQRSAAEAILSRAGLATIARVADLAGIERCLVVRIKTELTPGT